MRKKGGILGFIFLLLFGFSYVVPDVAQAVPAFARQTGLSCSSCHFQHFPALNAFGRAFKSGGYTMIGGQSMVEGDMLSLPSVVNASVVVKVRYQKTNGDSATGTNMGELQFPDEASLFLGGRVGENVGFVLEGQISNGADPMFASFKMPFVYDVASSKFSIIPFITDGLGPSFGFELLNTGAVRNVRIMEHRKELSAQQFVGTDGAAEGVAFVASNNMGFVNATLWTPNHGSVAVNSPAYYLRAVATPTLGPWDVGAGIQYWTGTVSRDATGGGEEDAKAMAVDAQAQGMVGSMPLGVYFTYAKADKSGGTTNIFNSSTTDDTSAFSVAGEIGVLPGKVSLTAAYRAGDKSGKSNNGILLGALYQVEQNIQFQLNHTTYGGDTYDAAKKAADGDQLTTLMMFTAF
ncbi:MAG: hypothetical protein HZA08_11920 [Nitrospirae bacterium]|nr:hypothetical protein [Nitrospirota bacterium]